MREARIRKGLTIRDMEASTKIRGKYLEALEEDDFEVLPGTTCVIGFLRTYATYLKLDADSLVEAYKTDYAPRGEEQPTVVRTDVTNSRRSPTSIERRKKRVRRQQGNYALIALVAVIVVALLAWFGVDRGQEVASIGAENVTSSTLTTTAPLSTESTVDAGGETTSSVSTTQAVTSNTEGVGVGVAQTDAAVKLVVSVAEGSCWLVVREDRENGAEVFAGTLSAGGKQTFDTSKRYWMRVGDPEVLKVAINDHSYTLDAPAGAFVVTGAGIERAQ